MKVSFCCGNTTVIHELRIMGLLTLASMSVLTPASWSNFDASLQAPLSVNSIIVDLWYPFIIFRNNTKFVDLAFLYLQLWAATLEFNTNKYYKCSLSNHTSGLLLGQRENIFGNEIAKKCCVFVAIRTNWYAGVPLKHVTVWLDAQESMNWIM